MDTYVHARPQSQQLAHARAVLATLADRPGMDGLAASEAFCVLDNTGPPYPPAAALPLGSAVTGKDAFNTLAAAVLHGVSGIDRNQTGTAAPPCVWSLSSKPTPSRPSP